MSALMMSSTLVAELSLGAFLAFALGAGLGEFCSFFWLGKAGDFCALLFALLDDKGFFAVIERGKFILIIKLLVSHRPQKRAQSDKKNKHGHRYHHHYNAIHRLILNAFKITTTLLSDIEAAATSGFISPTNASGIVKAL